jgi:hypothetical protein
MSSVIPSPLTWTLRFKNHKTTVLLHADALTPVSAIKAELLSALRESNPSGLNGKPLPTSPSQIQLAKPVDPLDLTQGWESLESSSALEDPFNTEEGGNGKGKQKRKLDTDSVKAVGIKDNAVIAFKWSGSGDSSEEEEGDEDMGEEKEEYWDVVLPSFTDDYGVENEGDAGVIREFKG